jgi:hypothetical protein
VAARVGCATPDRRRALLIVVASAIIAAAIAGADGAAGGRVFVMGAGLAVPCALAPRLALSALPAQAGQGSGIVNACTSAAVGVAGGAIAPAGESSSPC